MLYPEITPYASGLLDVGRGHSIYWEECGNPQGQPVVFLHGGPGGGCSARSRRLFDPSGYRVLLFDQRGCGRSTPHAGVQDNGLAELVCDMERLRALRQIERWMLYGGSWGTTLALAYAQRHRERVSALVLRGVFRARSTELDWLYRPGGASRVFPQAWQAFATALGPVPDTDLLHAYARTLGGNDAAQRERAALAWCAWEDALCSLHESPLAAPADLPQSLAMARISTHLFSSDPKLAQAGSEGVGSVAALHGLPGTIVQGQFDMVTPAHTAWQLHQAWPGSVWRLVREAGHAGSDPALLQALIQSTDSMLSHLRR